ncbi:MAG: hypothetical protein ACI909_002145 [Planctomycetota bacterium]|jgi:hypothetical protein
MSSFVEEVETTVIWDLMPGRHIENFKYNNKIMSVHDNLELNSYVIFTVYGAASCSFAYYERMPWSQAYSAIGISVGMIVFTYFFARQLERWAKEKSDEADAWHEEHKRKVENSKEE